MIELPEGPFNVILADPPWRFRNYSDEWHEGKKGSRWVGNQYGLMDERDIYDIPVAGMAAKDAALFLWTTYPKLNEAFLVMAAWGFKFKTVAFTWCKRTKNDKEHVGMGFWTRSNAEIVLMGTRGHPKRVSRSVRQIVHAPVGKHSAKPPEVRERIVQLMGDLPRVELFAREQTPGWTAWGDEA